MFAKEHAIICRRKVEPIDRFLGVLEAWCCCLGSLEIAGRGIQGTLLGAKTPWLELGSLSAHNAMHLGIRIGAS